MDFLFVITVKIKSVYVILKSFWQIFQMYMNVCILCIVYILFILFQL